MTAPGPRGGGATEALARDYLGRLDRGEDPFGLLAADAEVTYPKWGTASGHDQIKVLYGDLGKYFRRFRHNAERGQFIGDGEIVVGWGFSSGESRSGVRWTEEDEWGRWCATFVAAADQLRRVVVYADPDFAQEDRSRYPWGAFSRKFG